LVGGTGHLADADVVTQALAAATDVVRLGEAGAGAGRRTGAARFEADVAPGPGGMRGLQVKHRFAAADASRGATAEAAAQTLLGLAQALLPRRLGLALALGGGRRGGQSLLL